MIDMRGIYTDSLFQEALEKFNNKLDKDCSEVSDCKWSVFKNAFLEFSKSKCPICEDSLNRYDDIDHFRPKEDKQYPFLECCYQNYMIMCADCNRAYKGAKFPLYLNTPRATNKAEIKDEKPLLTNPTHDDIYELFELHFISSVKSNKKLLIISPKRDLSDDYKKEKSLTTIDVYGIGNCDDNENIDNCRIRVLSKHFEDFYELAKIVKRYYRYKDNDNTRAKRHKLEWKNLIEKKSSLKEYGFYEFIRRNQFKIAV